MDGRTDGWTDRQMDRGMDGWTWPEPFCVRIQEAGVKTARLWFRNLAWLLIWINPVFLCSHPNILAYDWWQTSCWQQSKLELWRDKETINIQWNPGKSNTQSCWEENSCSCQRQRRREAQRMRMHEIMPCCHLDISAAVNLHTIWCNLKSVVFKSDQSCKWRFPCAKTQEQQELGAGPLKMPS